MPQLCKIKETSYFTSAITSSLEYRDAYQRFFLGDTYRSELSFIQHNILNESLVNNQTFQSISTAVQRPNTKLHIFVEPTNDKVVEQINRLLQVLPLEKNKKIYLHRINYIKILYFILLYNHNFFHYNQYAVLTI